ITPAISKPSRYPAPEGTSSMYVEMSFSSGARPPAEEVVETALEGLHEAGLLRPNDRIVARHTAWIDPAYVLYDHQRSSTLEAILEYFSGRDIFTIGRFGRWEYSSMSDAVVQGLDIGTALISQG
ncbi:hypothetical protein ACFLU6_14590, partial [Acidobacteriota bacterium]